MPLSIKMLMCVDAEVMRVLIVNSNVVVVLDVNCEANDDNDDDLDGVVSVEVLPSEMNAVNEVGGVHILLDDVVHVEAVVNVDDHDNGDDEVPLSEVCHLHVVISSVVVGDDMIDGSASEFDVEVLPNVVGEDVDDSGEVSEDECECGSDAINVATPAVASHAAEVASQIAEVDADVDNDAEEDVGTIMDLLNILVMSVLEDVLSDVEVDVALLVDAKVVEDVNFDVEAVVLLEDARVSKMDVFVLLLVVKVDAI